MVRGLAIRAQYIKLRMEVGNPFEITRVDRDLKETTPENSGTNNNDEGERLNVNISKFSFVLS